MPPVDALQQIVQSQRHPHKKNLRDELGRDAKAKESLGRSDVCLLYTSIYFLTRHIDEPYYEPPTTDIYSVPAAGGAAEKLATIPMGIGDLTLSPDGSKFAFHGSVTQPVRSYSQPDLWVMDVTPNAQPKNLTADYDFDMGSSVFGDNAAPRGGSGRGLYWSPDGR